MGRFLGAMLAVLALVGAGGCREEGAGEKAGKKVDDAIERLVHGDEGPLEKAGRKIDEALEEAEEAIEEADERARKAAKAARGE